MKTEIVIPIIASGIQGALKDIKEAERLCDIVELRLDLIKDLEEKKIDTLVKACKRCIATIRPDYEGGRYTGKESDRVKLLKSALSSGADIIDIEHKAGKQAIIELIKHKEDSDLIISYHNYSKTPDREFLEKLYNSMRIEGADIVKISTKAESILDNFRIFGLMECKDNIAGMCMGVQGQISRILGPKYNSRLVYASLTSEKQNADGQIAAKELIKRFNFRSIEKATKVYGTIGSHSQDSFSPDLHNPCFKKDRINSIFIPLKVSSDELAGFMDMFRRSGFAGAAVTMPHKQKIMDCLDKIDKAAKKIGAVNTIKNQDGKLTGYNTDYIGSLLQHPLHLGQVYLCQKGLSSFLVL